MSDETNLNDESLETVAERADEVSASVLVAALADEGIRAVTVGGFTAGFRAETPGWVQVKSLSRDADRAKQVIQELRPAEADPVADGDDSGE